VKAWRDQNVRTIHDQSINCSAGVLAGELEGRPAPNGFERRDAAETRSRDGCATIGEHRESALQSS
jgi:hypothetical protein